MTAAIDTRHVEATLRYLVAPESTFEIRAFGERDTTLSGYFRDAATATEHVARSCTRTTATYVTLNPVRPELHARRADRITELRKRGTTTSDDHVLRRYNVLIDFDATPVAGISSSDTEHEASLFAAWEAAADLYAEGFGEPLLADSGNGAHVVIAVDLPADDEQLVERFLHACASRWNRAGDGASVRVDTVNHNPARISKLYGTWTRKGDSTDERPHRMSRIVHVPKERHVVSREQLEAFVAKYGAVESDAETKPSAADTTKAFDLAVWLTEHGVAHAEPHVDSKGRTVYVLDACPLNPEHSRGEAHVHRGSDGKIGAACKHQSCDLTWRKLRLSYEPDAYDKQAHGAVEQAVDYVAKHAMHADGPLLRRWRGDFYRWCVDRGHYAAQTDDQIKADLYRKLGLGKRGDVGEVRDALIAVDDVLIDHAELGTWLDGRRDDHDPLDLAACRNGILHLPTRTIIPATPRYFATTALGVNWDARPELPRAWLYFLKQLWPTDDESIALLQEWIGYLLTPDTRQQKILLLLGPKRSGKGTIARVIGALLGAASVASPTLSSLGTNFGLWPLIGKTAAVIGDARLGGRSDIAQVVERLLSVSGEDLQTIDRKHREPWTGKLATRITIISNEPPRFTDASDALACRMLVLELSNSFYGREDTALTGKLTAELPGILRWAIDGWKRLRDRGHFTQPSSSAHAVDDLIDLASPVAAWARQTCRVDGQDPQWWLTCADAYERFKTWCDGQGIKLVPTMTMFGRDVQTATGCRRVQVSRNGARPWAYRGLVLR